MHSKISRSFAQTSSDRVGRALVTSLTLALLPCATLAQEAAEARRGWIIEPSIALRETLTDNQGLRTDKEADAITEAQGAIRLTSNGGWLRGFVAYALTGSLHARHSEDNEWRHYLNAALTAELVEGQVFVDVRGSYDQQLISAFGVQSSDPALSDQNRTDVATLAISPYVRGNLGGTARYEARAWLERTRHKGADAADVDNGNLTLHADSGVRPSLLGWSADASHHVSDYIHGRRTFDSRARVGMDYLVNQDLKLGVSVGQERTDILVLDGETYDTWGFRAEWNPSERTSLVAGAEKRFFGNGHLLRFSHRTPNTVWTLSDTRDVSTSSSQGTGSFGSAYDLFFRQFSSTEPDAARRDVLVRNYLQANGINPNAVVVGGFQTSAATLERNQLASVALVGARNTVTLQFEATASERLDLLTTAIDDLSNLREIRQYGASLTWAHRITPLSSINVTGSVQRSERDLASQQTTLKSITAVWTTPYGARSTISAGARHATFDSNTSPYDENAVFAAIRIAF